MRRITHWLRSRGSKVSLSRREVAAQGVHAGGPVSSGMPRAPARSSKQTESEANGLDVASNDVTKLLSVEPAQPMGGSGVFVLEREVVSPGVTKSARARKPRLQKARKAMNPLLEQVTLVVYGWQNVEPGTLSWVFPSVGAAVAAARAMKNAVKWAIVAGEKDSDALDEARAHGAVLIEQVEKAG